MDKDDKDEPARALEVPQVSSSSAGCCPLSRRPTGKRAAAALE